MAARGKSFELSDFTGGLNTFDPEYLTPITQSPDLDNVVLLNVGFTKRQGDAAFNSSAMVSSSTPTSGLGYIRYDSGVEFLNAIAGTKFFTSSGMTGTMADNTGAITISAGQDNLWTPVNYNNLQIFFGGAPDAPFKYSGTGSAATLNGSAPYTYTGFSANNRVFAVSSVANPSRIYWPVLLNPEDWIGLGSGYSDVAMSDGEALQCGILLGPDTAILFKNSSTHLMVMTQSPFPIYQLQKGVGVAGRYAAINIKGRIFFITPSRRMKSTADGYNFEDYPKSVNDIWDSINPNRIPFIQGIYYQALEWIIWSVSTGTSTTNNYAIIWDLTHKCWLRCTTGFKSNVFAIAQNRRLFAGHYDGTIYEKDKAATFIDASETAPGAIDAYWRTPFHGFDGLDTTIHPLYLTVAALTESASTLEVSYGFDFSSNRSTNTINLAAAGGQWDSAQWDADVWGGRIATASRIYVSGRGNLFSLKLRNATASQPYTVQGCSIRLRTDQGRKVLAAT